VRRTKVGRPIYAHFRYTGAQMSNMISRVTGHKFTKFSHDIAGSSPLLMRLSALRYSYLFCKPVQAKSEGGVSHVCLGDRKTNVRFFIPTHRLTKSENLVKISRVHSEIFGSIYAYFCRILDTCGQMSNWNSEVHQRAIFVRKWSHFLLKVPAFMCLFVMHFYFAPVQ